MIRRSVAGAILGVSLLIGSLAWSGFVAVNTVFDPDRSREVAAELLDNDAVREQLADNLSLALRNMIPLEVQVSDQAIDGVSTDLLDDPAVEAAILNAFAATHGAFLGEGDAPEVIDLTAVSTAARAALVQTAPQLDALVPEAPPLIVTLPTERIPDASPVRSFLQRTVPVLAGVAILGAVLALFFTSDRPSILRRAGTWALMTTAFYLVIGVGVPFLLRQYAPDQAEVIAALFAALLRTTLVPSMVLGIVGVGLLGAAAVWAGAVARTPAPRAAPEPPPRRTAQVSAGPRRAAAPITESWQSRPPEPQRQRAQPAAAASPVRRGPAPGRARQRPTALPSDQHPRALPQRGSQPQQRPQPRPQPVRADHPLDRGRHTPPAGVPSREGHAALPPPSPYPDAPGSATPASPYPDAAHYERTHPDHAPSIYPDAPAAAAPRPPARPPDAWAEPQGGASVFDVPATSEPRRVASSAPPTGARWNNTHGWVLDPDSPDPLPEAAVWVDGVGYVLPVDRGR